MHKDCGVPNGNRARFVRVLGLLVVFAGIALMPYVALAQDITGTLTGYVQDATGAFVPGATVTITNVETNFTRSGETDASGSYLFLKLPAGKYELLIEKAGFKKNVQKGVVIRAAALERSDVTLEVGAVTQTVEVASRVTLLETVSVQQGGTMNEQYIHQLPLLGLNWAQLAVLYAGAQASPDRLGNSFNGSRTVANNFLVNGVDANDTALNTLLTNPSPEAIQEFQLITNTLNAEYGRNSGGLVQAVTKSGTNSIHGSVFYLHRDKGFAARNFFQRNRPDFNRNQWGATVGGPFWKDHTFFFFDYLALRQKIPAFASLSPNDPQVPTAAERTGNFSTSDPFTGNSPNIAPFNGKPWSTLFPGNIIPANFVNPIATKFLPFIPLANLSGGRFSSVGSSPTTSSDPGQYAYKIDHHMEKDTFSGYYYWREQISTAPFPFTGANVPGFGSLASTKVRHFTFTQNHIFSPTVVNEFRYGYSRLNFKAVFPDPSQPGNKPPSFWGFTGINVQDPSVASAPKLTIGNTLVLGFSDNGPQPRVDDTHQVVDNFTMIKGRHTYKFGIDFRHARVFTPFKNAHNGTFSFQGSGDFTTGNAFADFLLGVPDSYFQGSGSILDARDDIWYVYAQDTFKATPHLTLSYGVGWTLDRNWENIFNEKKSQIAFRPTCRSIIYPTAPEGICYTGDPGIPRGTAPLRRNNLGPRFGFAWTPGASSGLLGKLTGGQGKFTIRAGYGIYRDNIIGESTLQFLGNAPIGVNVNGAPAPSFATPFTSIDGRTVLTNPFPAAGAPPIGSAVDFSIFEPLIITSFDPNFRTANTQSYNFTMERQFGGDWLVRLAYVGSQGRNLLSTVEGNPVDSKLAAKQKCGSFFTQLNCPNVTRFVPGDIVSSVFLQASFANSGYNSFQAAVEKRFTKGIQFRGAYTYSKSIDNSNGLEGDGSAFQTVNPFDPSRDRSFSEFDNRHRFVLSYIWELPGPKSGVLGRALGGWRVSGVTTFAGGFPVFLTTSDDRCLIGLALTFGNTYCRPNIVGPVKLFDPRDNAAVAQGLKNPRGVKPSAAYFDPTAFARVKAGSGDLGNVARSVFHGPGLSNFDIGIAKTVRITERISVEPRVEFFNAFNHTNFNNPTGNANSTNFARVTSIRGDARIIQVGGNVRF